MRRSALGISYPDSLLPWLEGLQSLRLDLSLRRVEYTGGWAGAIVFHISHCPSRLFLPSSILLRGMLIPSFSISLIAIARRKRALFRPHPSMHRHNVA